MVRHQSPQLLGRANDQDYFTSGSNRSHWSLLRITDLIQEKTVFRTSTTLTHRLIAQRLINRFLGIFVGAWASCAVFCWYIHRYLAPIFDANDGLFPNPEDRLKPAPIAAICIPIAMFGYVTLPLGRLFPSGIGMGMEYGS